jgi:hypothetical protein
MYVDKIFRPRIVIPPGYNRQEELEKSLFGRDDDEECLNDPMMAKDWQEMMEERERDLGKYDNSKKRRANYNPLRSSKVVKIEAPIQLTHPPIAKSILQYPQESKSVAALRDVEAEIMDAAQQM